MTLALLVSRVPIHATVFGVWVGLNQLKPVTENPMTALAGWENFYVIVGSSAGALIGLQFVVMTLIAERPTTQATAGAAFATPTIVHFGIVLLLAAVQAAPWSRVGSVAIIWGALGICGIVYELIVIRSMRQQKHYTPVFEDWLFHGLLPLVTYAAITASAFVSLLNVRSALFLMGAAVLLLLLVGVHNAWDAVTYHVFSRKPKSEKFDGKPE